MSARRSVTLGPPGSTEKLGGQSRVRPCPFCSQEPVGAEVGSFLGEAHSPDLKFPSVVGMSTAAHKTPGLSLLKDPSLLVVTVGRQGPRTQGVHTGINKRT